MITNPLIHALKRATGITHLSNANIQIYYIKPKSLYALFTANKLLFQPLNR